MKKAKVMLATIAVFAVVGTALAFKVRVKNADHTWYFNSGNGFCQSSATTFKLIVDPDEAQANLRATYSTNPNSAAACAGVYLKADPL